MLTNGGAPNDAARALPLHSKPLLSTLKWLLYQANFVSGTI